MSAVRVCSPRPISFGVRLVGPVILINIIALVIFNSLSRGRDVERLRADTNFLLFIGIIFGQSFSPTDPIAYKEELANSTFQE